MKEFTLIDQFFKDKSFKRKDVILGIGDDCALTSVPAGQSLAITTDTLVSGVHFPVNASAESIAHKAVAVNLSDLAAVGAEPAWISLSLSLPKSDPNWIAAFADTLMALCDYYSMELIGGDTVQGPMAITITAHGLVPEGLGLTRNRAKPGDSLYVTGTLGDAGMGLALLQQGRSVNLQDHAYLSGRLNFPTPRVLAGTLLRRVANACIDISDGLVSDLTHILKASECGARVDVSCLPISAALKAVTSMEEAYGMALSAGDDYELLFSVAAEHRSHMETAMANANVPVTCIGQLCGKQDGLTLTLNGEPYQADKPGFVHFA